MMKKFLISATIALLTAPVVGAQTVFQENFATEDDFQQWTVIDANQDEKTWMYDVYGSPTKVYYTYHSTNNGDDWLISPVFTVPEDGTYLLKFLTKGSSYTEHLEVYTGTSASIEGMNEMIFSEDLMLVEYNKGVLINATAGEMTLGFHATSPKDAFRLFVGNISLEKLDNPVDLALTELISPRSGEGLGLEDVTVRVANNLENEVSEFILSYSLTVNGETTTVTENVVPETPLAGGTSMVYTFNTKADLSMPRTAYNIEISVSAEGDINSDNNRISAEVRNIAAATVPYIMGFEPTDDTSNLSFLNLNNDDGIWHIEPDGWFTKFSRNGKNSLCYNYNSANDADDWAFLDPLQLEAGYYCLKFWYSGTENHTEKVRVCWGTTNDPAQMTNVIVDLPEITNYKYAESVSIFEIPADGKYFVGFYAYSDKDENWICIDDVSIETVDPEKSDMEVMEITKPSDYWRAPNTDEVSAKIRNIGISDVTADVVLYIDNTEIARNNVAVSAMNEVIVTFPDVLTNLNASAHDIRVVIDYADGTNQEHQTLVKNVVTLPTEGVECWDFENTENIGEENMPIYALPDNLTYRVEDTYTVNSNAGAEFNEDGFGIFSLGQHPVLGLRALAVSTWFENKGTADRWIVLPQMEVTGPDAWFVWDAMSYNPDYLESYRVKVSDGTDYWSSYNTEASIDNETIEHKTRGISLSAYEGKQIYIAINVVTYDGEALILDNLGVYGDIKEAGAVSVSKVEISDNSDVEYYNLQGMKISAENLTQGLYIRKQGNDAKRIMIK